jgi:hypothetical protein
MGDRMSVSEAIKRRSRSPPNAMVEVMITPTHRGGCGRRMRASAEEVEGRNTG